MPRTIILKRGGGEPKIQIKIGNAHNGNFRVTALNENGDVVSDTHSRDLVNLDQTFPLADSADKLDFGIVTWSIRVISNNRASNDPYIITIEITQDGQTVKKGKIKRSGSLNQGVKVIAESVFMELES